MEELRKNSLWRFAKRLVRRFLDDDVSALAAESTYYFILGLVPFMIFLANAMLFCAAPQVEFILRLLTYLPHEVAMTIEGHMYRILQARSSLWMLVGLGTALWTSSQGVDTLIRAMDRAFFGDRNKQSYVMVKAKSLVFTMLITFAMIISLGLIVFGNAVVYGAASYLSNYFDIPPLFWRLWTMAKYGIPFAAIALSLSAFYQLAPAGRRHDWLSVISASFLMTFLWLSLTAAYGYYMLHISSMGLTYGSLIGLIVLFVWFHLTAEVIILGGEWIMAWQETRERG